MTLHDLHISSITYQHCIIKVTVIPYVFIPSMFNRHIDIDYAVIFKTNEEIVDGWVNVVSFYSYDLNTKINNPFFHQYSMFLVLLSLLRLSGII